MKADPRTLLLLQFALTDATWAAARAVVESTRSLDDAYLACGVAMLGLAVVPRLETAYATPKLKPAARFKPRERIARVAAFGSRAIRMMIGRSWRAESTARIGLLPRQDRGLHNGSYALFAPVVFVRWRGADGGLWW
jgi:hypothetical protein